MGFPCKLTGTPLAGAFFEVAPLSEMGNWQSDLGIREFGLKCAEDEQDKQNSKKCAKIEIVREFLQQKG